MATYLIIGSSSGIGAELSHLLVSSGHRVVGISRHNHNALSEHFVHDVLADQKYPALDMPLDGLVYCPGSITLKPFRNLKETDFLTDYKINVMGAVKALQAYLPLLQQPDNASVLFFSTVAVQMGMPFHASISTAKGAIEGLTRSLAAEFAPKIRVNAIAPSLTNTSLAARLLDTEQKTTAAKERHPLNRIGSPKEMAELAAFLLSPSSVFITGQILHADGGISSVKTH